ncbi:hypothetical protein V1509DRAFT_635988 [Lipomyces kononenkoae]
MARADNEIAIVSPLTARSASFNYYASGIPLAEDDDFFMRAALAGKCDRLRPFTVPVYDIRQSREEFNINVQGFQVLKHSSSLLPPCQPEGTVNFHDADIVKSIYWGEITTLVKKSFKARGATVVSTTVRDVDSRDQTTYDPKNPRNDPRASFTPFFFVHADYSATGARAHLRALVPERFFNEIGMTPYTSLEERETFLSLRAQVLAAEDTAITQAGVNAADWDGSNYEGPRWAMFSIWRPLSTVRRNPLGLMDARDLSAHETLPRIYRNRPGFEPAYKSANILPYGPDSEIHRWYWLPEQKVDEVYAIKLFDSEALKPGGPAAFSAPHSAFELDGTGDLPPRQSVDVRVILIW